MISRTKAYARPRAVSSRSSSCAPVGATSFRSQSCSVSSPMSPHIEQSLKSVDEDRAKSSGQGETILGSTTATSDSRTRAHTSADQASPPADQLGGPAGGLLVIFEMTCQARTSVDVQVGESVRIGDRFGQRCQWSRVRDALVWPVLVVEAFELAQRVQQVVLVPDQRAVE
jgi:hypothetical protein